MTQLMYRVVRTETIVYEKKYAREELVEMGVPPEVFEDGDLTADFHDTLTTDRDLMARLEQDTERHGDVQGSDYQIRIESVR